MNERIEETRKALHEHRQLSLLRRLGRRALGNYPTKEAREQLRRSELSPTQRIMENVIEAIDWTRRLNRTPRAVLGGSWVTASLAGKSVAGTVPFEIERDSDKEVAAKLLLQTKSEGTTIEKFDAIGFFIDRYSKWELPEDLAASVTTLGVVAFNDFKPVNEIVYTREAIDTLDPVSLQFLENATLDAAIEARHQYIRNRPERIG